MKKILFLLFLLAVLGGYQFLFLEESSPGQANISVHANVTVPSKEPCLLYRAGAEKTLLENETIAALFYSEKADSCLMEKRTEQEGYLTLTLINLISNEEIARFSSGIQPGDLSYRDYRALLDEYQSSSPVSPTK
ncbi:hypothetical protein IPN35_06035 [Candidatus Peregrinibacteria bacterium]|nr:MAG: hypothetical protein IPN35_06035 [Candidatus Peregrinibacteria bacterium]